jgi:hypothetical protein
VLDGTVSSVSNFNPSKPFLLYATLTVNDVPLYTLIDTGASATCINLHTLPLLSNVHYADRHPRSFLLADGVLPLKSTGLVELSLRFDTNRVQFYALTAEKLCVDLILGMDFMLAFHAIIDVPSQHFSINVANQRALFQLMILYVVHLFHFMLAKLLLFLLNQVSMMRFRLMFLVYRAILFQYLLFLNIHLCHLRRRLSRFNIIHPL